MDVFMEYLINRKKDAKDIIIISGIVLAALLLTIILLLALLMFAQVPMVGSIGMLLVVGIWWGAYQLMSRRNIDMLNGSLFKNVIAYTIPIILTGVLQLLFLQTCRQPILR